MIASNLLGLFLVIGFVSAGQDTSTHKPLSATSDEDAINVLYGEWSQATASKGAEGYASFFVVDAAIVAA